jgi:hypothetical protein
MSEEKTTHHPTFEGPIEKGETSHLPSLPLSEQEVAADCFDVESDTIPSDNLVSIVLPKFLLHTNSVVAEQSLILLTYSAEHSPSIFQKILKACKKSPEKFLIHFKNPENDDIISTWSFGGVRVHAVDFGYVARQRAEPATISVEISYNKFCIDDFEF